MLVVANQTVLGDALLEQIRERAQKGPASFLIISPQGEGGGSYEDAEKRLLRAVTVLRGEGIEAHGQISHPDPYTAVMQAIGGRARRRDHRLDVPAARSGWLRRDLVERLRDGHEAAGRARRGRRAAEVTA